MERVITAENIQRFRRILAGQEGIPLDAQTERMVIRLLAEEEAKLAALDKYEEALR